jgi:hypothetical protein
MFGVDSKSYPTSIIMICCTKTLVHVGEYTWTRNAIVLSTLITPSNETTWILHLLHLFVEVDIPPFIDDFHLETKVIFYWEAFISAFVRSPCLSFGGPLDMVYELLWDYFIQHNFANGFDFFVKVCGHIAWGHIPPLISLFFFHLDS